MKNFVQSGDMLDLVAPSGGVTSGKGVKIGVIIAIASTTAIAGASFAGATEGVFDVDSDTGAAWAAGDVVYWDDTNKVFTKTSTSNTKCGYAVAAKLSGDTTGRINLSPIF